MTFYRDPTCLSLNLINECASFLLFVVFTNHPNTAVHNKNIYCSRILFDIKTFYISYQSVLHDWCNKEGNVLFNDALNTFYLRLYGVRHMVKDHSDSEKGNLLPPHKLLFPISSKGSLICIIPQTG